MTSITAYPPPTRDLVGTDVLLGALDGKTATIPVASVVDAARDGVALEADVAGDLAAKADDAFRQPSAGFFRGLAAKVAEIERSIADYAVGDYSSDTGAGTDISAGLAGFVADAGSRGGTLVLPDGFRGLLSQSFVMPEGVSIIQKTPMIGLENPAFIPQRGSALYLDPAASITMRSSCRLGVNLFRRGLQFGISSQQVLDTFAGTAVVLAPASSDHMLEDMMILGFGQALTSQYLGGGPTETYTSRTKFRGVVGIDCINGVRIHNAADIPVLDGIECWPYVTVNSPPEANGAQLKRPGTACWLSGLNDWTKLFAPFNYGYKIGFRVTDGQNVKIICAGSDYPYQSAPDGSIGHLFDGTATEVTLIGGQAAARDSGVYVNSFSNVHAVSLIGCEFWECRLNGVAVVRGDVQMIGGRVRSSQPGACGVQTGANAGKVRVIAVAFHNLQGSALTNDNPAVDLQHLFCTFNNTPLKALNPFVYRLPASDPIILDGEHATLQIDGGVSSFGTLGNLPSYEGRQLTLVANASFTIVRGGSFLMPADQACVAGDVLVFAVHGGKARLIGHSSPGA